MVVGVDMMALKPTVPSKLIETVVVCQFAYAGSRRVWRARWNRGLERTSMLSVRVVFLPVAGGAFVV